jgi:MFS family permease
MARGRAAGRLGDAVTQLRLLGARRFAPFFWTQFLGALNDNLFKNALAILVVYHGLSLGGMEPADVVVLSAGLFILPFVLFSAFAGQLADRFAKPRLVRWIKAAEIALMVVGALALMLENLPLLLIVLFLMGAQSSFFGPVKYSILPQLLHQDELVGGNALVETGTFLAILFGTIAGGLMIAVDDLGRYLVGAAICAVALAGWWASFGVPPLPPENPRLQLTWNPVTPLRETVRATWSNRTVFLSALGISWFWFFGSSFIALLPEYGKSVLVGDEHVVTLLLALFCVGTACGSLLCERLSGGTVETGLVPVGSIGMSLMAFDLFLVGSPVPEADALRGVVAFASGPSGWRVMLDFVLLAMFAGLFIVPLYALVQQRSRASHRSRVIAGSNILGALFMVASSLMLMAFLQLGLSVPEIFAAIAVLNAAVSLAVYLVAPEFIVRFAAWLSAGGPVRLLLRRNR